MKNISGFGRLKAGVFSLSPVRVIALSYEHDLTRRLIRLRSDNYIQSQGRYLDLERNLFPLTRLARTIE